MLYDQIEKTGAEKYADRRFLEMYNNTSLLKAAELFPSRSELSPFAKVGQRENSKELKGRFNQ